jgi:RNA polymerase sigma factor (sigma-70 family)
MAAGNRTLAEVVDHSADFDAVYEDHLRLLVGTAIDRFHISEADAETLAHDVFLAYFLKAEQVLDSTAWLVASMCNASRYYLRTQARHVELPREIVGPARAVDEITDHLVAREVLCCLTPRCQLALGLRYLEGYSIPEVAEELRTSPKYAGKLVARCLQQAQDRYSRKERE